MLCTILFKLIAKIMYIKPYHIKNKVNIASRPNATSSTNLMSRSKSFLIPKENLDYFPAISFLMHFTYCISLAIN